MTYMLTKSLKKKQIIWGAYVKAFYCRRYCVKTFVKFKKLKLKIENEI